MSSSPRIFGLPPFKVALLIEICGNLSSIPILLIAPRTGLSFLLADPSSSTPSLETHTQLFGALTLALTLPLILSYPTPAPGPRGEQQRGFRKASYLTLGAGEACLGAVFGWNLFRSRQGIDVGWSPTALGAGVGAMVVFGLMRVFFLGVKKDWIENDGQAGLEGLWDGKDRKKGL